MDDPTDTPSLSQAFAATGPTPPSTWSSKPSESFRPKPSAKIRGLIGRLGLRYHPANSADLGSHQAMLGLLAEDLAHIDPELLERAIDHHVVGSPYMPKAADLIRLCQQLTMPSTTLEAYADELNGMNFSKANGWQWFVNSRKREDGSTERFLDRHDSWKRDHEWKQAAREIEATQAVIADLIAQGIAQAEFDRMQRDGTITRMVERRLAAR